MEKPVAEISTGIKTLLFAIHGVISFVVAWAEIDIDLITVLTVLIVIDFVTGLGKAHTLKEHITSNKMKYGVVSKASILLIVFSLAVAGKAIDADIHVLLEFLISMLVISELYSIIGNVVCIRSGEEMPEYDAISIIGKRIRNLLDKMAGKGL